jgi:hypothetical protein
VTITQRTVFRAGTALAIGLAAALWTSTPSFLYTEPGGDFGARAVGQARDLVNGFDTYSRTYDTLTVPYPMPVVYLGLPFVVAGIDYGLAGAIFIGLTTAWLAFAVTRQNQYWRLILFLSYPYIENIKDVQFAILYCLVMLYADRLAWPLTLIKPQLSVGIFMDKPKPRSLLVGAVMLLITLLLDPQWPVKWLGTIHFHTGATIPILCPFGFILLISIVKWRRREWRTLFGISVLSKRAFYDHLLAWLLTDTWQEMVILTALSWLAFFIYRGTGDFSITVIFYLALFVMMLRRDIKRKRPAPDSALRPGLETP